MRLPANEALPALLIKILLAASASYIIKLSPCTSIFAPVATVILPRNDDALFTVTTPPNEDVDGTTIPPTKEELPPTSKVLSSCITPLNEE